jgi:hypothetical protein
MLAFLIVGLAGDFAITRWAIYQNPSGDAGRLYHLLHEDGDEIPIFGSSKVYYDYVPSAMGLNVYNYGFAGTSYEVVDALLALELKKQKTTPIIIDLKPQGETGVGDSATLLPFIYLPEIRDLLKRAHLMTWRYYLPGLRYFGYYDQYLKEYLNDRAHLMRTVERGFSREKYWSFDRARLDDAVRKRLSGHNGYFPDEEQNARLIAQITNHPQRLFFLVYSPLHRSCLTNFENSDRFERFKAQLGSLPNAVVIDMEAVDYPDEWFKDTNHLLYDGAVAFSTTLGARVRDALREHGMGAK